MGLAFAQTMRKEGAGSRPRAKPVDPVLGTICAVLPNFGGVAWHFAGIIGAGSATSLAEGHIVRSHIVAFVIVLAVAASLQGDDKPTTQATPVDLKSNPLVQKALAEQDKLIAEANADYAEKLKALEADREKSAPRPKEPAAADPVRHEGKSPFALKLEACKAERQTKVDAAKIACVEALREAETPSKAQGKTDEASAIQALADRLQSEIKSEPKGIDRKAFVGRWVQAHRFDVILEPDGTSRTADGVDTGKWTVTEKGTIEVHWNSGWRDVYNQIDGKKWNCTSYNGQFKATNAITQP
jgi:hypothetical protein